MSWFKRSPSKKSVAQCEVDFDRATLVRVAEKLGFGDTKGKSQGSLCQFILQKSISDSKNYKTHALPELARATEDKGYTRDCLKCTNTRLLRQIAKNLGMDADVAIRSNPQELCEFIFQQRRLNPSGYSQYAFNQLNECFDESKAESKANKRPSAYDNRDKLERLARGGGYRSY